MNAVTNKMLPLLIALDPELFNQLRPEAQQSEAAQKGYQMATCTEAMAEWLRTTKDLEEAVFFMEHSDAWKTNECLALAVGANAYLFSNVGGIERGKSLSYVYDIDVSLFNSHRFVQNVIEQWTPGAVDYIATTILDSNPEDKETTLKLLKCGCLTYDSRTLKNIIDDVDYYYAAIQGRKLELRDLAYEDCERWFEVEDSKKPIRVEFMHNTSYMDFVIDTAYGKTQQEADSFKNGLHGLTAYLTQPELDACGKFIDYVFQHTSQMSFDQWLVVREWFKEGNPEHALLNTPEDVHAWVQSKLLAKEDAGLELPELALGMH